MAVFVDLGEDDGEPPHQDHLPPWSGPVDAIKPMAAMGAGRSLSGDGAGSTIGHSGEMEREEEPGSAARENPNLNIVTQALGLYPIVMSVASSIDLNTLDNMSRTCRQIRDGLLQYRKVLIASTLRCINDALPVDPEETLRYRARAGNWYYMQDAGRGNYNGKSGRIWKWRNQYTEVLGGLGIGIGEDGDAEDAREAEYFQNATSTPHSGASSSNSPSPLAPPWATAAGAGSSSASLSSLVSSPGGSGTLDPRTPSPALKPGYERHEVEGIGGVMKKMRVRMVKVGACVPEWEDERAKSEVLAREVHGKRRSWCGWCRRVIPSTVDYEADRHPEGAGKGKEKDE
ncbi:uncharacterized protein C8A04DRAFT_23851 [Dichotomopilus funicola]|uniref:F-box domain-containing protein n=1 Tax=Dichotomopilus funicola TaxID=1934379 RepID=A0AAN6ZS00_9PEZI|nr:hypothetical protein C8A04DRAFT_23851 [Dichotomopilus funicola]